MLNTADVHSPLLLSPVFSLRALFLFVLACKFKPLDARKSIAISYPHVALTRELPGEFIVKASRSTEQWMKLFRTMKDEFIPLFFLQMTNPPNA